MRFQARQGDVFIERMAFTPPLGPRASGADSVILAHGEITGHAHRVVAVDQRTGTVPAAQLFEQTNGRRLLLVEQTCEVRHDEHQAIALAPGAYSVTIQREYAPEGVRRVID